MHAGIQKRLHWKPFNIIGLDAMQVFTPLFLWLSHSLASCFYRMRAFSHSSLHTHIFFSLALLFHSLTHSLTPPLSLFFPHSPADTDDPSTVLCLYKTENECVMKFTYSEHASGKSVLTALREPGQCAALTLFKPHN